jgi:hypothetical protein
VANGVVYIPPNRGLVYAFDASTGSELWEFWNLFTYNGTTFAGSVTAGAAVENGVVYWPGDRTMWAFALPGWSHLPALLAAVTGVGPGTSLSAKITTIEGYVAASDDVDACSSLVAFIQSGERPNAEQDNGGAGRLVHIAGTGSGNGARLLSQRRG